MIWNTEPEKERHLLEPRDYYTEWSKSEREKQIIYAYIWSLERWYWQAYMQGNDGDMGNRLVDTVGEGRGWANWASSRETCITICKTASQWEFASWCRELKASALWQAGEGGWSGAGREAQGRGDICAPMAGSCRCMAGDSMILENNYLPIKDA